MKIDNLIINAEVSDVLLELKRQLQVKQIELFDTFKESGEHILTNCPYHKNGQERRPSSGFRKDNGYFHCFTCNENHSLAEVISNCFGYNDGGVYGVNWLINNFTSVAIEERRDIDLDISRERKKKEEIKYVSEEELDKLRFIHPYMYERGLNDEIIEKFDVGFDSSSNCITFPVKDVNGNCLFIARRSVNTKFFNYPNGSRKPIYGLYELTKLDTFPNEVIICESILDALKIWTFGKYAVALNGLGSSEQFEELSKMKCRKFILATDNDEAGRNARKKLKERIKNHLITEYDYSTYPNHAKDINDMSLDEFNALQEIW